VSYEHATDSLTGSTVSARRRRAHYLPIKI